MRFYEYLRETVEFSAFMKDKFGIGTIIVLKNGERHKYTIDSIYIDQIKKLSKKNSEEALEKLNNWVEKGWATKL